MDMINGRAGGNLWAEIWRYGIKVLPLQRDSGKSQREGSLSRD